MEDGEILQAQPVSPVSSVCSECYRGRLTLLRGLGVQELSAGEGHGDHAPVDVGTNV